MGTYWLAIAVAIVGVAGCYAGDSHSPDVDVHDVKTQNLAFREATAREMAALQACPTWLPMAGLEHQSGY
jgi:hypothetical protein